MNKLYVILILIISVIAMFALQGCDDPNSTNDDSESGCGFMDSCDCDCDGGNDTGDHSGNAGS